MVQFMQKNWFFLGMILVCIGGFAWPDLSRTYKQSSLVDWSIVLVMFCGGVTLPTTELWRQIIHWRAVGLSILLIYLVVPAIVAMLAWPLRWLNFDSNQQIFEGYMILAAQSGTLASAIVITTRAGANTALAIIITVSGAALAAVATPLILSVTLAADHVHLNTGSMALRLLGLVLAPVFLGQLARPLVTNLLARVAWLPGILSQLVILSFVFMAIGNASTSIRISPYITLGLVLAALPLHAVILVVNHLLSRLATSDVASRQALVICCSQKTIATGAYVWARYFSENPLGCLPLLAYHVVQLLIDTILANRWARKVSATP